MKNCRDCFYWSYDMGMDDFCVHPNASVMGTDTDAMRSTRKLLHTRGPNCGPKAIYFKPSKVRKPVRDGRHRSSPSVNDSEGAAPENTARRKEP